MKQKQIQRFGLHLSLLAASTAQYSGFCQR